MSQGERSTEKTLAGTMESPAVTPQKGSLKLLVKERESASATRPTLVRQRPPAPRSRARKRRIRVRSVEILRAQGRLMETIEEEPLGSAEETETFPVSDKELQSHFENLGGRKGAEGERTSLSPARTSEPESNPGIAESDIQRRRAVSETLSENGENSNAKVSGGGRKLLRGLREARPLKTGSTLQLFEENVSLKDEEALHQAAAAKAEQRNCFANHVSQEEKGTAQTNGEKASTMVQHAAQKAVNVGAQKMEALCQPKSTIPSVASRIKELNAIIKNQQHAVRCPHHLRAGAPNQNGDRSELTAIQVFPTLREPQTREPLRQPKRKINFAASRLKLINEIHKKQTNAQRCPGEHEAALLVSNTQWSKTPKGDGKDKDEALTGRVLCSNARHISNKNL
eukprot:XP_027328975.1 uncharacterized protein LOC113845757 [Anas platyrhynchos]